MSDLSRRGDASHGSTDRTGDPIEALLRTTGRRAEAPADRVERVADAVKAHWRADLRRRARRRWIWASASMAAAAVAVVIVGGGLRPRADPAPAPPLTAARVEVVVDAAWSRPAGQDAASPLRPGVDVKAGAEVATEHRGRVALRLATGHSLRLDTGTRVTVISDRVIALSRGAVYIDSAGRRGSGASLVAIRTPFGTLTDVGTQFEVRLATSLRVRVREGKVAVDVRGSAVEVAAGRELELGEDGVMVHRELQASDVELDWVNEITPMLDIDGRPLQVFLEWIARECGLQLRFADPEVAKQAAVVTLSGSVRGMSLDQALESVLSTCRMRHRLDGHILQIRTSSEDRGRP